MKKSVSIARARQALKKPLLIMKLTLLLTVCCVFQSLANVNGQTVTLAVQDVEISKVLTTIEKQGNFRFLYNSRLKDLQTKVNINFSQAEITEVLASLFSGTTLSFIRLENNLIAIRSENAEAPQDNKITGRITSDAGEALNGVSVTIKGTSRGTVTDNNGNFSLVVPDNATLVISAVGYETQELAVNKQTVFAIKLVQSQKKLDEVVVIGYGTASKRDLTGSITKILGKEVADRPNTNPVASLQGKVAGLSVVNSGTPGAEPDIRIRGTVSIGGVKPLYVVDGIFNDNIDYLNPNDIESIEVLKDPSSLAIFGIRGASGVIAITTKKAKAGQIVVNFNSSFGSKKLVDKIKMVDAAGFKTLFDEEQANIGVPTNQLFDYTKWTGNTDWVSAMTRTGLFNSNNISVAGSTERNKFYMGIGYTTDEGVVKHEKLDKILIAINDELKVSKAIKLGFNFNGIRQKLPFSQANGLLYDARRVLPITEPFNEANGVYTELAIQAAQIGNPLMNLENKWDKEIRIENRMVGSVYADINFLRFFNLRTTFYGDMSNLDNNRYSPIIYTYNPTVGPNGTVYKDANNRLTSVDQSNQKWNKFQQDYILTFKKTFGDHGLTAIAGFTTYYNNFRGIYGNVSQKSTGDSIPNDKRFWYISNGFGDPSSQRSSSNQWEKATASGLFRVLYNYKNKYLLNGSFRRDGSSQISPSNRYKNYYSIGAGWEVTREDFMATQKFIDFLKIKASWGLLGVQNTYGFDYPFYPALLTGNTAVFGNNIVPAYSLAYEPNRNLTWEVVDSKEVGFELYAFNNRLHVEAAYYSKLTKDVMTIVNFGTGQRRLDNVGSVKNNGIELAAGWVQKLTPDLTLTINANFTTFKNKVISLGGDKLYASEERPNQTEAGFPIGYFYGYIVDGIYQSYADKLGSPKVSGYEYGPGDLKYRDIDKNDTIDTRDRTIIGNPTPDFSYGGSINLTYKGFDLGIDVGGVYGNEVYRFWGSSELPFTKFNYAEFKLNRWHGEGTSNWDPILGDNHVINRLPSTYGIEDGSYFRIRNLQIGYNFDQALLRRTHIKGLRIFANAQNLKTFKHNSGYTPEFGGTATSFGIDNGNGPVPMVLTGGINVTF